MTDPRQQASAFASYLVESWNEVKPNGGKVSWPTFEETKAQAWVVLGASVALGVYLFLLDNAIGYGMRLFIAQRGGQG